MRLFLFGETRLFYFYLATSLPRLNVKSLEHKDGEAFLLRIKVRPACRQNRVIRVTKESVVLRHCFQAKWTNRSRIRFVIKCTMQRKYVYLKMLRKALETGKTIEVRKDRRVDDGSYYFWFVLWLSTYSFITTFEPFDKNFDNQWLLERLFLNKGKWLIRTETNSVIATANNFLGSVIFHNEIVEASFMMLRIK